LVAQGCESYIPVTPDFAPAWIGGPQVILLHDILLPSVNQESEGQGVVQDCEFTYLSTQILHLLGLEGPKTFLQPR
jgi:hypothetical protein